MHRSNAGTISATTLALALVVVGCRGRDAYPARSEGTAAAAGDVGASIEATLRVADITGNPDRYVGQTVTVEGKVDGILGPYAFKLDDDAALAGGIDNDLRVLWPRTQRLTVDDQWLNRKVRVTGVVHRMATVELEREVGWDFDTEIEAEFEGSRPVLIAQSVERVAGG